MSYLKEEFTDFERAVLSRFFTDVDGPVFALINLPETVKAALFARYSRTSKSLRRLFIDEFYDESATFEASDSTVGMKRSQELFERVILDYGDDSVAQLGGVHLACEQVSNSLTKVLERSRMMSYLEQSTRYLNFGKKRDDGRYGYKVPPEILDSDLECRYRDTVDALFESYNDTYQRVFEHLSSRFGDNSDPAILRSLRAASFDAVRGILPVATLSNLGIFGSPQAFEYLVMRLRSHPLGEARQLAEMINVELQKVIPSFLSRIDRPDRGVAWVDYRAQKHANLTAIVSAVVPEMETEHLEEATVRLIDFQSDAETRILEAILFEYTGMAHEACSSVVARTSMREREELFRAYVGDRKNRRHRPGRAFEAASYVFEIVSDYGAFRDLQRHRLMTIEWRGIDPVLGYVVPPLVASAGLSKEYARSLESILDLYDEISDRHSSDVAAYLVPMAYRIRYRVQVNARELMHITELRTQPAGHESYRKVAQAMHRLIGNIAGHNLVSEAMSYVDYGDYDLGRLSDERESELKQRQTLR